MLINPFTKAMRKFREDRSGVSAVEFALILPVFALLFFASIEVSFLMLVDRKVTQTASTLGDLVARATAVSNSDLDDIFHASNALFQPYDGSKARMRVTSVQQNGTKTEVLWSEAQNMTAYSKGASVTIPSGLLENGQSVVISEVSYDYDSTLGYFLPSTKVLDETFYLRPRRTETVERR
ncbi:TadE/TadG family type IV pilus assembly protein [Ponticaulis profundi]|uniref:TadE/TadG family type IV pilus assembly protein n=1 Tax=Ponticaulis profundi TaxID=2665222 RepID=A0ABW1S8M5_9PROT